MDQLVLDKIRVIQWTKSKVIVEGNVWVKPVMLLFSLIKQREICWKTVFLLGVVGTVLTNHTISRA